MGDEKGQREIALCLPVFQFIFYSAMKHGLSLLLKLKMETRLKDEGEKVKKLTDTVLGKWSHVICYLKLFWMQSIFPHDWMLLVFVINFWAF